MDTQETGADEQIHRRLASAYIVGYLRGILQRQHAYKLMLCIVYLLKTISVGRVGIAGVLRGAEQAG